LSNFVGVIHILLFLFPIMLAQLRFIYTSDFANAFLKSICWHWPMKWPQSLRDYSEIRIQLSVFLNKTNFVLKKTLAYHAF